MSFNSDSHHRHTIRLYRYDYSSEACYFITICTQEKKCLFGRITDGVMIMNELGRMIGNWYLELGHKFPTLTCLDYIIMPNHFHCIVHIDDPVGADLCVRPDTPDNVSLSKVVQWFKTMTTNEYYRGIKLRQWVPIGKHLWQRNYYEHIIRNAQEFDEIVRYIRTNPTRWCDDEMFVK